jgi:ABC-type glycerol-3-phosphate transport system permease component
LLSANRFGVFLRQPPLNVAARCGSRFEHKGLRTVALAQFLNSDEAPWNYMMATAIVYALPPVAIYYAFRHRMTAGLTMGGVKG